MKQNYVLDNLLTKIRKRRNNSNHLNIEIKKPDDGSFLEDEQILKKLGNGDIKEGKKRLKQLLQRKVYWKAELNEFEIQALLKNGYIKSNPRNKDLIVRDENGYFDYVICLPNENESLQHLRDKEFIAGLNRNISQVEWIVPGTQKRADVAFNLNDKKLGVEVQNSALEYSRLEEKIEMLERNFDQWFLIVPKNFADNYYYLSTNKGKVTIMKEAIKEIIEILKKNNNISKIAE